MRNPTSCEEYAHVTTLRTQRDSTTVCITIDLHRNIYDIIYDNKIRWQVQNQTTIFDSKMHQKKDPVKGHALTNSKWYIKGFNFIHAPSFQQVPMQVLVELLHKLCQQNRWVPSLTPDRSCQNIHCFLFILPPDKIIFYYLSTQIHMNFIFSNQNQQSQKNPLIIQTRCKHNINRYCANCFRVLTQDDLSSFDSIQRVAWKKLNCEVYWEIIDTRIHQFYYNYFLYFQESKLSTRGIEGCKYMPSDAVSLDLQKWRKLKRKKSLYPAFLGHPASTMQRLLSTIMEDKSMQLSSLAPHRHAYTVYEPSSYNLEGQKITSSEQRQFSVIYPPSQLNRKEIYTLLLLVEQW